MARIFISFFNGVKDENDTNAIPCFFEAFINGLKKYGNDLFVFHHKTFFFTTEKIPDYALQQIKEFNPELIILFNNNFYNISDYFDCPIVIYEVDSVLHYGNKDVIRRNPDRYKYIVAQESSKEAIISEFGVSKENILNLPFFTEIYNEKIPNKTNISFIGTLFYPSKNGSYIWNDLQKLNPSEEEKQQLKLLLEAVRQNPFARKEELYDNLRISSEKIQKIFDMLFAVASISAADRLQILRAVADLGLSLYGTPTWGTKISEDMDLVLSYNNQKVYSLKHNQDIYNSSKLSININHIQAKENFSWRVCDIMASNSCLVTTPTINLKTMFKNIQIPTFTTPYEAREICTKLLNNENMREDIVLQCQEIIDQKFRFKHILPTLERFLNISLQTVKNIGKVTFFNEDEYKQKEKEEIQKEIRKKKEEIMESRSFCLKARMLRLLYSGGIFISLLPCINFFAKNKRKDLVRKYNNVNEILLSKYRI